MSLVRFPSQYVTKGGYAVSGGISGVVGGSGASAQPLFPGTTIQSQFVGECLTAKIVTNAFTNGLQLLCKWQVLDDDQITWQDAVDSYNPANVALNTGTGASGGVLAVKFVTAPEAVRGGNRPARCVVYGAGSGPALGSQNTVTISYDFRAPLIAYGP